MFYFPFKILSTDPEVNRHVTFIHLENPDFHVARDFEITRLPYALFHYSNKDKWETMPINPNILYSSLRSMVDNLIYYKTQKKPRKPYVSKIKEISSNDMMENYLSQTDFFALMILPATYDQETIEFWETSIEKLEILSANEKYSEWKFGWVNATCHEHLLTKYNFIPNKGGVNVYMNWKKQYTRFAFPFDDNLLWNFFDGITNGKYVSRDLTVDELKLEDNFCNESNLQRKKESERIEQKQKEEEEASSKKYDDSMKTDL